MNKKPLGFKLLILLFIWSTYQSIGQLFRKNSVDPQLFDAYHIKFVFYVYVVAMILLGFTLIYTFWTRKQLGYKLSQWVYGTNIIYLITTLIIGLMKKEVLVDAALKSRIDRGLSTEGIESATNSTILVIISLVFLIIYLLAWWYTHKNRNYFQETIRSD